MRIRRVCVLGGTGFVGHHLASALTRNNFRVTVLTRHRERHRELLVLPTLELVEVNVHAASDLGAALQGCDAVINLVGILNEWGRPGEDFQAAHVTLPRQVAEACRANNIPRLLHMSALNASVAAPSQYLRSKGEGERVLRAAAGSALALTILRPSVVFGPGDALFNRFARLLTRIPLIIPLPCPDARLAPVYVEDVVQAFLRALEDRQTWGRSYDLCGPRVYTLAELVSYTAEITGRRRHILRLNARQSRRQARLLERFPSNPLSWDNYLTLQVPSICRENGLLALGITPTGIEAVVPKYLGRHGKDDFYRVLRSTAGRG